MLFGKLSYTIAHSTAAPMSLCPLSAIYQPCQIQLGPRYEGQLNSMAEPIPHAIRPLVRTQVYHPYFAADRQAETEVLTLRDADAFAHRF